MTAPILLTEDEAAARIGVSARTLRDLRAKGMIRYVRPSPRKVYYRADDVADYLDRSTIQETPPCPSTSQRKAVTGNSTTSLKVVGIMDRLAARPGGMPKGTRPTTAAGRR